MIPFRIRLGVTGHRELPNETALTARVRQVLDEQVPSLFDEQSRKILGTLRHTPLAYSLFTSLAEGADRLVAREVLRRPSGWVEAILPLTDGDYRETFTSPESVEEFEGLLQQSRHTFFLRTRPLKDDYPGDEARDAARRESYARGGRHVVDACDILLALWDGEPAHGVGGTAETVAYARKVGRPVIHINTADPSLGMEIILPEKADLLNAAAAADIEVFNRLLANESLWRAAAEDAASRLLSEEAAPGIPEERRRLIRERILPVAALASEIATRNQSLFLGAGLWAHTLSVFAVGAVAAAVLVPSLAVVGYGLELAMLVVILGLIGYANARKSRRHWVEHRFLAERVRIAFHFAVCGAEPAPIKVPPHMESLHGPRTWMFRVFEEIRGGFPFVVTAGQGSLEARAAFARNQWVKGQTLYHRRTSKRCARRSHMMEYCGMGVFGLALLAAAVHLLTHGILHGALEKVLTGAALLLPAVGASLDGIRSHRDYSRLARRSCNLDSVLSHLDTRFSLVRSQEELEARLREMEEIIALEGQEWFSVMRFVTIEPVP
jgi:hypothetical protein